VTARYPHGSPEQRARTGASTVTVPPTERQSRRWVVPVVAMTGVVSHAFGRSTMPILLPAISDELFDSLTLAGILGSANFAAYMAGVIVVTWVSGRMEPVILLRCGLIIVACGLAVLAMAQGVGMLFVGTALAGFGGAGIWITAPGIATADVAADRRGAVLAMLTATMGAALVIIPQVAAIIRLVVGNDGAWRQVWVFELVLAAAIGVALLVVVHPSRTPPVTGGLSLGHLRAVRGWVPATIAYVAFAYIAASFVQFLGLALTDDAGFSSGHVTLVFSVLGAFSIVGPVLFGRLSDRRGRRMAMIGALVGMAAGSLLVTMGREPFVMCGAVVFGVSSFSYPVLVAAFVRDHTAARAFGAAFGMMTIFYGFGAIAGPLVTGVVGDRTGSFTTSYVMVAVVAMFGAVAAWQLPRGRTVGAGAADTDGGVVGGGRS